MRLRRDWTQWVRLEDIPPGRDAELWCGCIAGRINGGQPRARIRLFLIRHGCDVHNHMDIWKAFDLPPDQHVWLFAFLTPSTPSNDHLTERTGTAERKML
jgi:hypothetical protein